MIASSLHTASSLKVTSVDVLHEFSSPGVFFVRAVVFNDFSSVTVLKEV